MTTYTGTSYSFTRFSDTPTGAQVSAFYTSVRDALTGAGLVQTSDTGQLSVASTTWPGTANTDQGYFIYRFNDTQQGTDPVFIKMFLGRGNSPGAQRIRIQVGQGSDGSGTLTGSTTDIVNISGYFNTTRTGSANVANYACAIDGACWFLQAYNALDYDCAMGFVVIERTRDPSTGAFDGRGVVVSRRTGGESGLPNGHRTQSLKWSGALKSIDSVSCCLVPGEPSNTALTSGDKQLYPWWYDMEGVDQMWSACTVRRDEVSSTVSTFTASPYKTTSRTMINFGLAGTGGSLAANARQNAAFVAAFVWE